MTKEELIKILDGYEVFVDDDWGGSYKSIISYAPDKSVSRAHTSLGALEIIDAFDKMQKEKQELIDYLKEQIHYIKTNFSQVNGNYFMLNDKLETYEDILSKLVESDQIEKE